jgi:hypothetical protein
MLWRRKTRPQPRERFDEGSTSKSGELGPDSVRGKLLRPAEPHAAGRLGPLAALAGAGADQGAFELSETAQTSDSVRANCAPLRGKGNILDLPDRAQALQPGILCMV